LAKINSQNLLVVLMLLLCGFAAYQFAWLPGSLRRAHLAAEQERLRAELAAQEQLLGQRAAVLEAEQKWQAEREELARRLPPLKYWPEMLARVENLFFRPGLTVTAFSIAAPSPLPAAVPPGQEGALPAAPALQPGDLLAAKGQAMVTADSKEEFFNLLAGLEALEFLAPVRTVSYTLSEGKVQGRLEFELLLSFE